LELLPAGSVQGGTQAGVVTAAGTTLGTTLGITAGSTAQWSALLRNTSAASTLAGTGNAASSLALGGGTATYDWTRQLAFTAQGQQASFMAQGRTEILLQGTQGVSEVYESSSTLLAGVLRVVSEGAPPGTPVRVGLSISALFLNPSVLPLLTADGQFDVLFFEGLTDLARFSPSASQTWQGSFDTRVGAEIDFQIGYVTAPGRLGPAFNIAAGCSSFISADSLTGQMSISVIPEPQSLALLLCGLVAVTAAARRR